MRFRTRLSLQPYRHNRLLNALLNIPLSDRGAVLLDLAEEALLMRAETTKVALDETRLAMHVPGALARGYAPTSVGEEPSVSHAKTPRLTAGKGAFNYKKPST